MPPTVILVRHGEAFHNVTQNYDLPDPGLTPLGKEQCVELESHLQNELPLSEKIDVIISSPMVRTLQTTLIGLDWLIKRGVKIELDALWQVSAFHSPRRRTKALLES